MNRYRCLITVVRVVSKALAIGLTACFVVWVAQYRNLPGSMTFTPNSKQERLQWQRMYEDYVQQKKISSTAKEMASRRDLVSQVCAKQQSWTDRVDPYAMLINEQYKFSLCRVAKVASTFWLRFLHQLQYTNPVESPFNVSVRRAYAVSLRFMIKKDQVSNFRNKTTRLVFVREPFSRLLSAYVDKVFPPNPIFWGNWGVPAIKNFRPGLQKGQKVCGNDASFSEFISFVVSEGYKYDQHLIPVYTLCSPCHNNFTAIGKMETFQDDATFVASQLGISEKQLGFEKMARDKASDAIEDSTGGALGSWLEQSLKCISREEVVQRLWRKLQIRGIVSWRQKLRLTELQKQNINLEEFRGMLFKAQELSTDKKELKFQKNVAFVEAFRTLDDTQFGNILSVYGSDFEMLGYSVDLVKSMLEEYSHLMDTHAFDWKIDWDLSHVS